MAGMSTLSEEDLYEEAVVCIQEAGTASRSMLQRRLKVNYNKADQLIKRMEREGIVGDKKMTFEYIQKNMYRAAALSPCEKYRYALSRLWDMSQQRVVFIGLNPSTADAIEDDPTIRRCVRYAFDWGYGGVYMLNLFAYRATNPKDMMAAEDPVGPRNDKFLLEYTSGIHEGNVVAAWGTDGAFLGRDKAVKKLISPLHCLSITKDGHPGHPLYLKKDLKPVLYSGDPA